MYLDDLIPAPDSKKIAQIATKIFGYSVDIENISEKNVRKLQRNFNKRLEILENNLGAKVAGNKDYLEAKIMLETLDSKLSEVPAVWVNQISTPKAEEVVTEGALEGAELTLAAKDMVDRLQGMLEDLGEMQNEDLGPLVDAIRDEMGTDIADQFNAAMGAVIGSALEAMRGTRETADGAARILTGEDPDMIGAEEPAMEPTTGMEMPAGEMPAGEMPAEEDFGAAEAATGGEEELGRAKRI